MKFWELVFSKRHEIVECFESSNSHLCSTYDELNRFLIGRLKDAIDKYFESQNFQTLLSAINIVEKRAQNAFKMSLKLIPEIYLDEKGDPIEVVIVVVINWNCIKNKTLEEAINKYLKSI